MIDSNDIKKINESNLDTEIKEKLIKNQSHPNITIDTKTLRLIILILGSTLILTVLVAAFMGYNGQNKEIPDLLIAVSSASVGALAGLIGRNN